VSTLPLRPNYDKLGVALYVFLDSCSKNMYDVIDLRNRLPVGGGCVYVLHMFFLFFWLLFSPSVKNMRQPFSGTAERIFMKLLPNDTAENVV